MAFILPSFSSCDWSYWGLTPLPACSSWKHRSLSPPPVWFAWFTDDRWSSCQSIVHSHCLTQLIPPYKSWASQLTHPPHRPPPFTTLLPKVTRSHRCCARLLCGCHDNHGGLLTGHMYRMAVMDWTLGAVRRNYTFGTLSIFFVPEQWNG